MIHNFFENNPSVAAWLLLTTVVGFISLMAGAPAIMHKSKDEITRGDIVRAGVWFFMFPSIPFGMATLLLVASPLVLLFMVIDYTRPVRHGELSLSPLRNWFNEKPFVKVPPKEKARKALGL